MIWTETENNTKHDDVVVVKFTNLYGVEAHKCMAEIGMAPQFIAIHDLPPNWKVGNRSAGHSAVCECMGVGGVWRVCTCMCVYTCLTQ